MKLATRVLILDETVCILHSANTLGKGMNPIILSPAMGKIVGQLELFKLSMVTIRGEEKTLNLNLLN